MVRIRHEFQLGHQRPLLIFDIIFINTIFYSVVTSFVVHSGTDFLICPMKFASEIEICQCYIFLMSREY